jgi:hypothetical protein
MLQNSKRDNDFEYLIIINTVIPEIQKKIPRCARNSE